MAGMLNRVLGDSNYRVCMSGIFAVISMGFACCVQFACNFYNKRTQSTRRRRSFWAGLQLYEYVLRSAPGPGPGRRPVSSQHINHKQQRQLRRSEKNKKKKVFEYF